MKSILIAATLVGAVTAGLILYLTGKRKVNRVDAGNVVDAATEAYHKKHGDEPIRPAQHAMG